MMITQHMFFLRDKDRGGDAYTGHAYTGMLFLRDEDKSGDYTVHTLFER